MPAIQIQQNLAVDLEDDLLTIRVLTPHMLDQQSEELRHEFTAVIGEYHPKHVVLDLSHVAMISSMGVGVLISLLRRVRAQGGDLALCHLTPGVEQVFRLCRLLSADHGCSIFCTYSDVDQAATALRSQSEAAASVA